MNISIVQAMIDAIDKPAIFINQSYIIEAVNKPYRDTYPVDIKLGYSTCFSVSHRNTKPCDQCGEQCPIKVCQDTKRPASVVHVHATNEGQSYCDILMRPIYDSTGSLLGYLEVLDKLSFASNRPAPGKMVGESNAFKIMLNKINRAASAASADIAVLLHGETGTGKELVSRALHDTSARAEKPFVVIECTGLTDSLFESELFGYEKGAFTGATTNKKGLVDAAEGGTLFFDEIGDVPLSMQVKLLRLFETQTYRPVGSVNVKQANFRLVCATHKNLKEMVQQGTFRQDLYYRIAGFPITLPALRERQDDIELLANHILAALPQTHRPHTNRFPTKRFDKAALAKLKSYSFPGNIRELKNIIEQASLLADDSVIYEKDLPEQLFETQRASDSDVSQQIPDRSLLLTLEELESQYISDAYYQYQGDVAGLASALDVSARTLYRKLQKAGVKVKAPSLKGPL